MPNFKIFNCTLKFAAFAQSITYKPVNNYYGDFI